MARYTLLERLERLNSIGIGLSLEKDQRKLLVMILSGARELTGADGGTLYLLGEDRHLHFEFVLTESLGISLGCDEDNHCLFPPIPLQTECGAANLNTVVGCSVIEGRIINLPDVYRAIDYDFSGTAEFDRRSGYRSQSMLVVPMKDHTGNCIGALQLINAMDAVGQVVPFGAEDERLVSSLASQAAVALNRQQLVEGLENLLQSLVQLVATAIDDKSPYTGGHCRRVPEMTMLLAKAIDRAADGCFADARFTADQLQELEMAAWLHDCGKITIPEHVVDKATKLETVFDRIALVEARLEILRQGARIDALQRRLDRKGMEEVESEPDTELAEEVARIDEAQAFLRRCNTGGEFLGVDDRRRIEELSRWSLGDGPDGPPLLTPDEVHNLSVSKGTLTDEERDVVQGHITSTIGMLGKLPFPDHLRRIPEIAGAHHERIDGKGYPKGLGGDELSLQARILALADVFEALTACDRPYRQPLTLSKALSILAAMSREGHIDPDLFALFVRQRLYLDYGRRFLKPEQIDEFDGEALLASCDYAAG